MEKIVRLKSPYPNEYSDKIIECEVLNHQELINYIRTQNSKKFIYAKKNAPVEIRLGCPGEIIKTVLFTDYDEKKYVFSECENEVNVERPNRIIYNRDIVVCNISSFSREKYIIKYSDFVKMYKCSDGKKWFPISNARWFVRIDKNIIISNTDGCESLCLKGSYISIYDMENGDIRTIEKSAFESTYEQIKPLIK